MGLDMYLNKCKYISNYEHSTPEERQMAAAVMTALGIEDQTPYMNTGATVELRAAYWRKANAIHGWFVRNVQNCADYCQTSNVTLDQLVALRDLCTDVLDGDIGKDELPPTQGFFFGNDNAESYREDLKDTVTQLNRVINAPDAEKWEYVYQASW